VDATPLDPGTRERLEAVFVADARSQAERLLVEECGPDVVPAGDHELVQVRRAALRVSRGDLVRLQQAIDLARHDWRDLRQSVFGDDPLAHERWYPGRPSGKGTGVVLYVAFFSGAGGLGAGALWVKESFSGGCDGGLCGLGLIAALVFALVNGAICGGLAAAVLIRQRPDSPRRAGWIAWAVAAVVTALMLWVVKLQIERL
jgi:hypothetical protein